MTFRTLVAALVVPLLLAGSAVAADVVPRPGAILTGTIKFPREQQMRIETDARDGSRFLVRMGFDGQCKGGGLQEAWVSTLAAKPSIRVRGGRFSATVRGTERNLGSVAGRTGEFTWKVTGRFTAEDAATATVTGSAVIKSGRKVISRCAIARPTTVRLSVR
jgi:opacity protein-like surface antigen